MAHKVFISYKFKDEDVYPLGDKIWAICGPTTVRDYVNVLQNYFDIRDFAKNKGERDGEDLSGYSGAQIWEKLKPRIYDSTVTIVMISPNMREPHRSESSQWIPREISHSLKEMTRNDRTSHSNAMLAVVLPDRNGSYEYFENDYVFYEFLNIYKFSITDGKNILFDIIRENMYNKKNIDFHYVRKTKQIYANEYSYIKSVYWSDFVQDPQSPQKYIDQAIEIKSRIDEYEITKEV